ncbi:hypothetical protein Tco_0523944 [Tanacetum coccineum]
MKDKVTDPSLGSDIGIDAIPTATKPPSVVDWKIIPQPGQKAIYQIIRRDGSNKIYMSFGAILKDFSRDNLIELYSCLTLDASTIYMLADIKYPLSKYACQAMLNMKLQGRTKDEVCYQLLKMIEKQAEIRWSGI